MVSKLGWKIFALPTSTSGKEREKPWRIVVAYLDSTETMLTFTSSSPTV